MRRDEANEGAERALEAEIGEALARLPLPKAPETLLARVMLEVGEYQALPWYRAGWFHWPMGLRVASLLLVGALAVGFLLGLPLLEAGAEAVIEGPVGSTVRSIVGPFLAMAALLRVGIVSLEAMRHAFPEGVLGALGAAALLMMSMTVVFIAALRRLSLGREHYS